MPISTKTIKHSIISGGSSGIGLALARLLVARGENVSLLARNQRRLDQAVIELDKRKRDPDQKILAISADVCDVEAVNRAITHAVEELGPLNYVIMSAGIVHPGYFEDLEISKFKENMDINYFGSLNMIKAAYPILKEQKEGRVLFISSGAGIIGLFGYSPYSPTKFAVRGLAEVLRAEFKRHNIKVSIAYPADTDTPQYQHEVKIRPPETSLIAGTADLWSADKMASAILSKSDKGVFQIAPGWTLGALLIFQSLISPLLNKWFDFLIKLKFHKRA